MFKPGSFRVFAAAILIGFAGLCVAAIGPGLYIFTRAAHFSDGTRLSPGIGFHNAPGNDTGIYRYDSGGESIGISVDGFDLARFSGAFTTFRNAIAFSTSPQDVGADLILNRVAANTLGLHNSTSPNNLHVYNTRTDAANYERLAFLTDAGAAYIGTQNAGTGVARPLIIRNQGASNLELGTNTTTFWRLNGSGGHFQGVTAAAGIGYGTGSGGTVTQLTNKATGVTLNTVTGAITMNGAALAAATIVSFTLTNSAIAAGDMLVIQHYSTGTSAAYTINAFPSAGSAVISVRNNTAGSLSEAIVLRFAIIKSSDS